MQEKIEQNGRKILNLKKNWKNSYKNIVKINLISPSNIITIQMYSEHTNVSYGLACQC